VTPAADVDAGADAGAPPADFLFVRQVVAMIAGSGTPMGECLTDASPSNLSLLEGSLDVAIRTHYEATLLVGFQSQSDGGAQPGPGVALQEAVARLEDPTGQVVWGPFSIPLTGFADTPGPNGVSYAITNVTLVGSDFAVAVASTLQSSRSLVRRFKSVVRVRGKKVGGAAIESDEFGFPLSVCYGCLVVYPPDANDPLVNPQPNCRLLPPTGSSVVKPCRPGQDDSVDCRVCKEFLPTSPLCEP
jgi:hypothetical protein